MPRPIYDHSSILLDAGGINRGPSPFRFEIMWLKVEGFKEMLKFYWQSLSLNGTYTVVLASKMKALKALSKAWNRDVFRRVECWRSALKEIAISTYCTHNILFNMKGFFVNLIFIR